MIGSGAASFLAPGPALLFVAGVGAAWLVVPLIAYFALRRNAMVLPGGRSIHSGRIPLLGGLAIALPFVAYLFFEGSRESVGLALGCLLMAGLGALDDLRGLSPRVKILGQVLAAFVLVGSGYRVPELLIPPFAPIPTAGVEIPLIVFWVVLVTNAINLIDGMDGLATTVALVAALACAVLGFAPLAALVLAGATLGFLRHNLPQARIFLGDSGSLMLGFAVSALLLNGSAAVNRPLALGAVALPLGDVALAAARRWLRGKPIFTGDQGHVHHRLLRIWNSPGRVLLGLAGFAGLLALIAGLRPDARGLAAIGVLWLGAVGYLIRRTQPRWQRILLNRRAFRRIHLAHRYAADSLRLAEQHREVVSVMERVAEDFDLTGLRLRSVKVERPRERGSLEVEEHVDCGETTASWSAAFSPTDSRLAEEQKTVLCDLLRLADGRLSQLEARPPEPVPEPAPRPPKSERPAAHFIADGRRRLEQISPLVRETRRRGVLDPIVVFTGRRDALALTNAQLKELGLEIPAIELDVAEPAGIPLTARVMERYDALAETAPPALVVVGSSPASVACALVAKERGMAVAQVGRDDERPLPGRLAASLADVTLAARDTGRRPATGQLLFRGGSADAEIEHVAPALEALLADIEAR